MDQSSFAAPQGISQRTTSFIASQRQGIHQMLLRHLITLTIDVRMPSAKRADMIIKERPVLGFLPRHLFACQAYPARTAAGRRWFAGLGARSPNMLPLYDFKHPRLSHDERTRTSDKIHPKMDTGYFNTTQGKWWSLSGSNRRPEACKATALPAELRPLGEAKVWFGLKRRQGRPSLGLPRASARTPGRACDALASDPRTFLQRPTGRRRRFAGPKPTMVGLGRLERPTSPLSGVRSNHLSYRPEPHPKL